MPLRTFLTAHDVSTVFEKGWSRLSNGHLLAVAAQEFDVLVTTDRQLRHQQNLSGRKIAIFVLPFASWPKLQARAPEIVVAMGGLKAGVYIEFQ